MSEVARILLAASGARALKTRVFTTSGPWVAPATTNELSRLTGKGSDGSPATPTPASLQTADVVYFSSGSGNTAGVKTWSSIAGPTNSMVADFNNGLITAKKYTFLLQYPATHTITLTDIITPSGIPGTAYALFTGDWTGGDDVISGDGQAYLRYQYMAPATNGTASTAFGNTFLGGSGAPATPVAINNVAVTPGASYNLVIPSGGSITIEYYE